MQQDELNRLFSLSGKVAVVTGACGLLGKEHCLALDGAGAHVVVADLNLEACRDLARQLRNEALPLAFDITQADAICQARDEILNRFGQIDVLVNNAAINDKFEDPRAALQQSQFEHYPLDLWNLSIEVNLTGMFLSSQILGTPMAERRCGSIINIASTYGMNGPDQSIYLDADGNPTFYKSPAYPVTKAAVINFTRYLAAWWGKSGVRVNTLSPGGVENGQASQFIENYGRKTVLGRMSRPEEYRGAIIFLASEASSYMSGANLVVDGGWTAI